MAASCFGLHPLVLCLFKRRTAGIWTLALICFLGRTSSSHGATATGDSRAGHGKSVEVFAGTGALRPPTDLKTLRLDSPFGINIDSHGSAFIVEMTGHHVLRISPRGDVIVLAGDGLKGMGGDSGPSHQALVNGPHALALQPNGDLLFADTWNNRVRRISAKTGLIQTLAGTGVAGYSGDGGPALQASFGGIYGLSLDRSGNTLFLADLDNRRIRAVDLKTGLVRTVAGNGKRGVPDDGAVAVDSPLVDPRSVTVDRYGNIYILERNGNALRQVDPQGRIRTVVGKDGKPGSDGDGGAGTVAHLRGPKDVGMDLDGTVLIADSDNHLVRRYHPRNGQLTRVAGTGKRGAAIVKEDSLRCELNQPHGVWVHPNGDLYISDSSNHRILRLR